MAGKRNIGEDSIWLSNRCIGSPLESLGYRPASAFVTSRRKNTVAHGANVFTDR